MPYVGPTGRVLGGLGLVLAGQGALQGKVERVVLPSGVRSLLLKAGLSHSSSILVQG